MINIFLNKKVENLNLTVPLQKALLLAVTGGIHPMDPALKKLILASVQDHDEEDELRFEEEMRRRDRQRELEVKKKSCLFEERSLITESAKMINSTIHNVARLVWIFAQKLGQKANKTHITAILKRIDWSLWWHATGQVRSVGTQFHNMVLKDKRMIRLTKSIGQPHRSFPPSEQRAKAVFLSFRTRLISSELVNKQMEVFFLLSKKLSLVSVTSQKDVALKIIRMVNWQEWLLIEPTELCRATDQEYEQVKTDSNLGRLKKLQMVTGFDILELPLRSDFVHQASIRQSDRRVRYLENCVVLDAMMVWSVLSQKLQSSMDLVRPIFKMLDWSRRWCQIEGLQSASVWEYHQVVKSEKLRRLSQLTAFCAYPSHTMIGCTRKPGKVPAEEFKAEYKDEFLERTGEEGHTTWFENDVWRVERRGRKTGNRFK